MYSFHYNRSMRKSTEKKAPLEIERKWMVNDFPMQNLPLLKTQFMRQGYLTVSPTVRIREEDLLDENGKHLENHYVICFKSKGLLTRKEIEIETDQEKFNELEDMIGLPLINKIRKTYLLPGGYHLEVNHVDEGLSTEFWYAEIEFPDENAARTYQPSQDGLEQYLNDDVTEQPGQSMGAYWEKTRLNH